MFQIVSISSIQKSSSSRLLVRLEVIRDNLKLSDNAPHLSQGKAKKNPKTYLETITPDIPKYNSGTRYAGLQPDGKSFWMVSLS